MSDHKAELKEMREQVRHWGQRLEDVGVKLHALKDDPESFTREETLEIVQEAETVFAVWHRIQFALNLQQPTNTIQ